MVHLMITKLHKRYLFPPPCNNEDLEKNLVNQKAMTKFSRALSAWKTRLRGRIDQGKTFDDIHKEWSLIPQEDWEIFKDLELAAIKEKCQWGKDMQQQNVGHHNLGSRGYGGKEPMWKKQDDEWRAQGKENPFDQFEDPLAKQFVRV